MPLPEGVTNKSAEMVQIFTPRLDNADTVSQAFTGTSAETALPSESRFLMLTTDQLCYVQFTDSGGTATSADIPVYATAPNFFAVPNGATHIAVVRDSTDGTLRIFPAQKARGNRADPGVDVP